MRSGSRFSSKNLEEEKEKYPQKRRKKEKTNYKSQSKTVI